MSLDLYRQRIVIKIFSQERNLHSMIPTITYQQDLDWLVETLLDGLILLQVNSASKMRKKIK